MALVHKSEGQERRWGPGIWPAPRPKATSQASCPPSVGGMQGPPERRSVGVRASILHRSDCDVGEPFGGTWPAPPGGALHCCSVDCSTAVAAGCFSRNTVRTSCGQRILGPARFQSFRGVFAWFTAEAVVVYLLERRHELNIGAQRRSQTESCIHPFKWMHTIFY